MKRDRALRDETCLEDPVKSLFARQADLLSDSCRAGARAHVRKMRVPVKFLDCDLTLDR